MFHPTHFSRPVCALALVAGMVLAQPAFAYKTERVCVMTEETAKAKARKICKTMLVMTDA